MKEIAIITFIANYCNFNYWQLIANYCNYYHINNYTQSSKSSNIACWTTSSFQRWRFMRKNITSSSSRCLGVMLFRWSVITKFRSAEQTLNSVSRAVDMLRGAIIAGGQWVPGNTHTICRVLHVNTSLLYYKLNSMI